MPIGKGPNASRKSSFLLAEREESKVMHRRPAMCFLHRVREQAWEMLRGRRAKANKANATVAAPSMMKMIFSWRGNGA